MTKNENLRLCGGTFFTLLLEARKQLLGANEHYAGKKDGLTEYETLIGLARVIRSDLATPMPTEIKTIQGNASEYKKCKNAGGGYFPFGDKTALRVFDERVKNEYVDTLRKMCRFVEDFIDAGGDIKKDELLVKALQDNGIKVYYQILNWIPQQKINELRFELGIEGCSGTNELNRMHWAIKKINAVEVLREAGIPVFSL